MELHELAQEISKLDDRDLSIIQEHIRGIAVRRASEILDTLLPGAKVHFDGRHNRVENGIVEKVNQKTVVIRQDKSMPGVLRVISWRLSPGMVKHGWKE